MVTLHHHLQKGLELLKICLALIGAAIFTFVFSLSLPLLTPTSTYTLNICIMTTSTHFRQTSLFLKTFGWKTNDVIESTDLSEDIDPSFLVCKH